MNKILICGFNGKNNSSKLILDEFVNVDKIYLKNSFTTSVKQLYDKLDKDTYEYIFLFGQRPNTNSIDIETCGTKEKIYKTNYDYSRLKNHFNNGGYNIKVSNDAGTYLCNNIYYHCLKYIDDKKIASKCLFIHIPSSMNLNEIKSLSNQLMSFFYKL